jgi:hypothetical protein
MKVDRIDHIHVKCLDLEKTSKEFEKVLGQEFLAIMDFTEDEGNKIAFSQFPIGLELMEGTDASKGSGVITDMVDVGTFALSLKVPDMKEAVADMKSQGYKEVWTGEFGEIKESLFDTREKLGVMIELISYATDDITAVDNGGLS